MLASGRLPELFSGTPCIGIHGRERVDFYPFTSFHDFWEMISGVQ